MAAIDDAALDRFEALLRAAPSMRIRAEQFWRAFAQIFPHRTPGPAERHLLLDALNALEARGAISLPPIRGTRWDRSMDPAVPTSITLVRAADAISSFPWRTFPWHAELQWIPRYRFLSPKQVEFLRRVHDGLVHGRFQEPAPLKYRSLQLTGDEKRLALLATTSLFAEGQLNLPMLGCLSEAHPLAWEAVGEGGRLVIFENAGPFAVARRVLGELTDVATRPYDLIAYGGGRSVLAGLGHLLTIEQPIVAIHYVGDLDDAGVDILWNARQCAARLGLPPLQPATELHRQMLLAAQAFGHPDGWPTDERRSKADRIRNLEALEIDVRPHIDRILRAGRRIPEEVLGSEELRRAFR